VTDFARTIESDAMIGEKGRAEWLTKASLLLAVLFLDTLSRAILSGARLGLSGLVLRVSGEVDAVPAPTWLTYAWPIPAMRIWRGLRDGLLNS
jgi:hypothetical protein